MRNINLKLKEYGTYIITKKGVFFYTEHGFKIFVPKKVINRIEGML